MVTDLPRRQTGCSQQSFGFHPLTRRAIRAQFDGGAITSDGGGLLLREVERRTKIVEPFAACFTDHRDPERIEHTVKELVAQGFGHLDPTEAQDQRIEEGLQRFAYAVAVVSLREPDVLRERTLQSDALKKLLDQRYAPELCQPHSIESNVQVSWSSGHYSQTSFLMSFHCKPHNNAFALSGQRLAQLLSCS